MSDIPKSVRIMEEGPREGFQIEKGPITTAQKIELIDALSQTGLHHIQIVSFVNPKRVPGMADAEAVVKGITPQAGVEYEGLWLNGQGMERAIATGRLKLSGKINMFPSEKFLMRNQNRTIEQHITEVHGNMRTYKALGIPVDRGSISSVFGCNFQGDIPLSTVLELVERIYEIAAEHDIKIKVLQLADTMAWGTPEKVKRTIGAIREKHPDARISLHLHDTRGMGIANAFAGLEMGVDMFDASVAGLGGCPFGAHKGSAGNVCTEDLVFMCHEMGIETGIDLDKLIECAQMAEEIVGHPLPGSVKMGGNLNKLRATATH
jgi:hydroxymethylglutaryl-CoA lyase